MLTARPVSTHSAQIFLGRTRVYPRELSPALRMLQLSNFAVSITITSLPSRSHRYGPESMEPNIENHLRCASSIFAFANPSILVSSPAAVVPVDRTTGAWAFMATPSAVVVLRSIWVPGLIIGVHAAELGGHDIRLIPSRLAAVLLPFAALTVPCAWSRREDRFFTWWS